MNTRNSLRIHRVDTIAEERVRGAERRSQAAADVLMAIVLGLLGTAMLAHFFGVLVP